MKIKLNSFSSTPAYLMAAFVVLAGMMFLAKPAHAFNPLYYTAVQNGPLPVAQSSPCSACATTAAVVNNTLAGGQPMYWFLTSNVAWLSASKTCQGTTGCADTTSLAPGASTTINVTPNTSNLPVGGPYVGTITVNGYSDPAKTVVANPATATITVNYTITAPCTANAMTSTPATSSASPIPWNSSATLNFSSNNCTSATLSGGQYGAGTAEPVSGTASTGVLTTTTTFTFKPCGPGGCATPVTQTVNVGAQPCYIAIASTYNGAANTLPPSGFNYTLTGSSVINGSNTTGASPWAVAPGASWTLNPVTPVSGTVHLVNITPSNAQGCLTSGSTTTFTANFADNPPPAPGGITGENTQIDPAAVACTHIRLSWGASANATSYYLYRSTSSSNPALGGNPWVDTGSTATTYDYVPLASDPGYFYFVAAHNNGGTSAPPTGPATASALSPSPCNADFSVSNKVLTKINNNPFPFTSPNGCIGNGSGTVPKTIRVGDKVSWSINICNQGNQDATNVVITDTLTDLAPVAGSYVLTTSPPSSSGPITPTMTGTCATGTCTLTFNIASVPKGTNAIITYDTTTLVPTGTTQTLNRFRDQVSFTYNVVGQTANNLGCTSSGTGSANPCVVSDPGFIVFFNGPKAPNQTEINP